MNGWVYALQILRKGRYCMWLSFRLLYRVSGRYPKKINRSRDIWPRSWPIGINTDVQHFEILTLIFFILWLAHSQNLHYFLKYLLFAAIYCEMIQFAWNLTHFLTIYGTQKFGKNLEKSCYTCYLWRHFSPWRSAGRA